jgi:hypothetical protein
MELAVLFKSDGQSTARQAIIHAFEQVLMEYIVEWLSPDVGPEQAERLRNKCGGVMDALTLMGMKASLAVNEAVREQVRQATRTTD